MRNNGSAKGGPNPSAVGRATRPLEPPCLCSPCRSPTRRFFAAVTRSSGSSGSSCPMRCLITDAEGRRTFETDALTAYRCMPLAVVLPGEHRGGERDPALLPRQQDQGGAARRRHLALAAARCRSKIPSCSASRRMTRVLSIDEANRVARVEAGITNIAITNAAAVHGFFYAPDPSSQLACTLGGNIATNSGGAHCLKYGVTVNNLLRRAHGADERRDHRHRRRLSRCPRLRLPRR